MLDVRLRSCIGKIHDLFKLDESGTIFGRSWKRVLELFFESLAIRRLTLPTAGQLNYRATAIQIAWTIGPFDIWFPHIFT